MINTHLFDFDGVLVDTMEIQSKSLVEAVGQYSNENNLYYDNKNLFNSAITTKEKISTLVERGIVDIADTEKIYMLKVQIADKKMLKINPNFYIDKVEMFKYIKQKNDKIAIVTNANRKSTLLLVDHLGYSNYVDLVITNNDVDIPKPSPFPYQKAMEILESSVSESVIYEDSPTGLRSAIATGCKVVKIDCIGDVNLSLISKLEGGIDVFYSP